MMGRRRTTIPVKGPMLRDMLLRFGSINTAAEKLDVTRQQLHNWWTDERIPAGRLAAMVRLLGISAEEVRSLSRQDLTHDELKEKVERLQKENKRLWNALCELRGVEP